MFHKTYILFRARLNTGCSNAAGINVLMAFLNRNACFFINMFPQTLQTFLLIKPFKRQGG
ncbi:hypothetical protein C1N64_05020 [Pantoea sp. SGAir0215]